MKKTKHKLMRKFCIFTASLLAFNAPGNPPAPPTAAQIAELIQRAQQGDRSAQLQAANLWSAQQISAGQLPAGTAFQWLKSAENGNDKNALRNLGIFYHQGWGTAKDDEQALKLLSRASALGDIKAPRYIGFIYADPNYQFHSRKRALSAYQLAAERGDITARQKWAEILLNHSNDALDEQLAFELLMKDVDRKDHITAPGFEMLGDMTAQGRGTEKDPAKAKTFYQTAIKADPTLKAEIEPKIKGLK